MKKNMYSAMHLGVKSGNGHIKNDDTNIPLAIIDTKGDVSVVLGENKVYIKLRGYIDDDMYQDVLSALLNLVTTKDTSDIVIFIDSTGGAVESALHISNMLFAMDNKIITVEINNCSSSACILFATGEERYMLSGTEYMLHQLKACVSGEGIYMRVDQYNDIASDLKKCEARYREALLKGSKIPKRVLDKVFNSKVDTKLREEQILEYKIATKIFNKFSELPI